MPPTTAVSPAAMGRLLWPHERDERAALMELLKEDVFRVRYGETVAMERERTQARIRRLSEAGVFDGTVSRGDVVGVRKYDRVLDVLALLDHSLDVKLGVNFGLFSATVRRLGTPEQYRAWLPKIESLEETGCFALTELGHGSNVRGIETVATYDAASQEFVIHTPTEMAQKYWIGAAAETAGFAAVFAQLTIGGKYEGIHVFIVRLRDKRGNDAPGVQTADCGVKMGLNGVDNGRIWFTNCRIPRKNMLSAMSQVAPDGTYTSSLPSPDARFSAQLAALTGGRVGIAISAVSIGMLGLAIAVRYSLSRRAFSPAPGAPEVPLMYYTSQQKRLMVPLASAYVYTFCSQDLRALWYASIESGIVSREVHSLSAGFKAMFTWYMQGALQNAREACGGQGYKSDNRIAVLKADRDIMLTFEGANDVMMQQVAKGLLAELKAAEKSDGKFARNGDLSPLADAGNVQGSSNDLHELFIRGALLRREKALIEQLGARYAYATRKQRMSAFDAWNACLETAQDAATAHMHRRIFDMHLVHVQRAGQAGGGCGEALRLCGRLWAADVISSDAAFLRLGCINADQARDVHRQVPVLCANMASIASDLVDAFEFPDHLLAPIAGDFVSHNSRAKL